MEYVGWFVADGNTLYTDIWEIKPPLAFLPTYLFAQVTGTNMYAHHLLGIATTATGLVLTVALTARIVGTLTESPVAGLAAGVTFLVLPDLFYLPWLGYKAKMMVYVFGLAALDRAVHDRHFTSGLLAGLAVGFWQLSVVFPLLTTIYTLRNRSFTDLKRHVAGGAAAVGVIGTSLLLYADVGGFLAEVVLGPLVLQSETGAFDLRTYFLFFNNDLGRWVTLVGAGGLGLALLEAGKMGLTALDVDGLGLTVFDTDRHQTWPLAVGGLLVTLIVVFIDFDGLWDMVYPLVFTALGVGILVSYLPRRVGIALLVVFALLLVPTFGPSEFVRQDPVEMESSDGLPPALDSEREHVYWTAQSVRSCRFFGGGTQQSILQYYPEADSLAEAPCGDVGLYWAVTRERLSSALPSPLGAQADAGSVTPTAQPGVTVTDEGFDYRVENDSVDVTVPLVNEADERRPAEVVVEVVTDGETVTRCREPSLAGGERTTLRFRFEEVSTDSLSISLWVDDDRAPSTACR
nr:DolP-mannose mannosyltransferase [Salinirubrum litoreum]